MRKTKVLVLGNSKQISNIDFSKIRPDIITLGVNRIWLKHFPNYFFFNDFEIIKELLMHPEELEKLQTVSSTFSSDWLKRNKSVSIPSWVKVFDRINKSHFPDSVTNSISLYSTHYNSNDRRNTTYYIAGVDLQWSDPSHFWKELNYDSLNTHDSGWYSSRFDKIFYNFKTLKNQGFNIVSVTPESKLNKLFRYENIETLYTK